MKTMTWWVNKMLWTLSSRLKVCVYFTQYHSKLLIDISVTTPDAEMTGLDSSQHVLRFFLELKLGWDGILGRKNKTKNNYIYV